jgi:hypothetical protein
MGHSLHILIEWQEDCLTPNDFDEYHRGRGPNMKKVAYSLKAKPKQSLPVDSKKDQGLCSCCKFAFTCTYRINPDHPVLQCEEFEGIVYSPDRRNHPKKALPLNAAGRPLRSEISSPRYMGLCTICEERDTCTYPKPEGGVWHCEEFR